MKLFIYLTFIVVILCIHAPAFAQNTDNQNISKELDDPVSDLINMPVQMNWDSRGGKNDHGQHYYLKFQPVIPLRVYHNWRVISRSIIAVENKHGFGYTGKTGLGDLTQTFFISPTFHDETFKWGIGPAFLIPTATEKQLGNEKWGAGPSFALLKETPSWSFGLITRHIWSFAGNADTADVNKSVLQPYITRHFKNGWAVKVNPEYTYDWVSHQGELPINLTFSKVITLHQTPLRFSFGGRYYADKMSGGPDWGLRASVTLVFPRYIKNFIKKRISYE